MSRPIVLYENLRIPSYAPFYLAIARGDLETLLHHLGWSSDEEGYAELLAEALEFMDQSSGAGGDGTGQIRLASFMEWTKFAAKKLLASGKKRC